MITICPKSWRPRPSGMFLFLFFFLFFSPVVPPCGLHLVPCRSTPTLSLPCLALLLACPASLLQPVSGVLVSPLIESILQRPVPFTPHTAPGTRVARLHCWPWAPGRNSSHLTYSTCQCSHNGEFKCGVILADSYCSCSRAE